VYDLQTSLRLSDLPAKIQGQVMT